MATFAYAMKDGQAHIAIAYSTVVTQILAKTECVKTWKVEITYARVMLDGRAKNATNP
jgi:hypothetical protein